MNLRSTFFALRSMSRFSRRAFLFWLAIQFFAIGVIFSAAPARAMPEYATRVGEPCASCHVSPAGGGLRNVRGQAWVASEKPTLVPETSAALKILGVVMPADMSIYTDAPTTVATPVPFKTQIEKFAPLVERLLSYEGN